MRNSIIRGRTGGRLLPCQKYLPHKASLAGVFSPNMLGSVGHQHDVLAIPHRLPLPSGTLADQPIHAVADLNLPRRIAMPPLVKGRSFRQQRRSCQWSQPLPSICNAWTIRISTWGPVCAVDTQIVTEPQMLYPVECWSFGSHA